MHDVYNFIVHDVRDIIVANHLAFTVGAGGFLVGWVTGSLRRRRKPKAVEVYDYYGVD